VLGVDPNVGGRLVRKFTFYGLDGSRRVVATDELEGMTLAAAKSAARSRLAQYETVELWDATVLILRERRGEPKA
jgi:hypothetical protein